MKLEGTYTFEAPQQAVWDALMDPEVLARVMPGCEKLEKVGENAYDSVLKIKVGPVQGTFTGNVVLSDINAPHSYHMSVKGQGAPGHMTGEGDVRLTSEGNVTTIHYGGEAKIGGRLASVGQRLMESSAKSLTHMGLENLNHQIQARIKPPTPIVTPSEMGTIPHQTPPPLSTTPPVMPSQADFAKGVAKHMANDLVPPSSRPWLIAAVGSLGAVAVIWWLGRRYDRPTMRELGQQFNELREQQIKPAVTELGKQLAQLDERQIQPFIQQLSQQLAHLDEQQVRPFVQEFSHYVATNFNEKKLRHLGKSLRQQGLGWWNETMQDHMAAEAARLAQARATLALAQPKPTPATAGGVLTGLAVIGAIAWWFFNRSSSDN